jgi:hypothetical protein
MVGRKLMIALCLLALVAAGCQSYGTPKTEPGDLAVKGWESGTWKSGTATASGDENFVFEYETVAFEYDDDTPFHKMKTVLRLSYDPDKGEISDAKISSLEAGYAYRHVCFTPAGPVLRIRVITHLDGRSEDLTIVRLEGPMPSVTECMEVGVGPWEGLVEILDVLFEKDGSYTVMRGTGAHLTGPGIRVERTMSTGPGAAGESSASYPDRGIAKRD